MNQRGFNLVKLCLAILLTSYTISAAESLIRPGDRIAFVGNTFADQLRNHGYLETLLVQHFRDDQPVSIRNLGWAGDTLTVRDRPTNFPSEATTLSEHKTDVIIACFGMGESYAGLNGIDEFKNDLRDFIASHKGKLYNKQSEVRLIFVSPIAFEKTTLIAANDEQRNAALAAYTQAMEEVAKKSDLPFINLYQPTRQLMNDWDGYLTSNGIHLTQTGYWLVSQLMFNQLVNQSADSWKIDIDTENNTVSNSTVKPIDLNKIADAFEFSINETSASLPPPFGQPLPKEFEEKRDRLIVSGLAPGSYRLSVDGEVVVTASHEDWAQGVAIDRSPVHHNVEKLRAAIIDKNQHFVYSWKALNQVHIVGERRHSPSGRALPKEVIEFNNMTKQKEQELVTIPLFKTRKWRLEPAKISKPVF